MINNNEYYNVQDVCDFIIRYSNKKGYGITNLKLQKLLYFIQAYYLVAFDKPCFEEPIEGWDFGPVVPEVYKRFLPLGGCDIQPHVLDKL